MIYGFYFHFLRKFRSKTLSIFLSRVLYSFYLVRFEWKRLRRKRCKVSLTKKEALKIVERVYEKPNIRKRKTEELSEREFSADLSIIVPVYNYVNLIRENIESILNQNTKYKYEVILIDDGSTDGTFSILKEYENKSNIKVIRQNNKGIAGARNTGIDAAAGKYLMFIDCDDVIHEDMVEKLLNRAFHDSCDMVMCAHSLVKQRGEEIYQIVPNIYPQKNLLHYVGKSEILNYPGLPWCKVYCRELWSKVRFLEGYWYEDTIIQWLIFPQVKRFQYIPESLYEYRWYEKNFSHVQGQKKNYKAIDRYWMLIDILDKYKELQLPFDELFYTLLLKHLSAFYYRNLIGLDDEIIEAMFVLAQDLWKQYCFSRTDRLPYMLRVTEKALVRGDISLWMLASCYQ